MSNLTRSLMLGGGGSSSGSTYLGPMTWAELQASAYANGSVGLAALSADTAVFITDFYGGNVLYPSKDKTFWGEAQEIILANFSSTALGNDCMYAGVGTTATAVASASAGAKTRVTHTGHGLTSTNNGVSLPVTAGTNWAVGLYPFTYVDANTYDLDVAWNAAFGVPTITAATGSGLQTQLRDAVDIPVGLMQNNSRIEIASGWELTSSANAKYLTILLASSNVLQLFPSSVSGFFDPGRTVRNRGVKNAQIGPKTDLIVAGGGAPRKISVDFTTAQQIKFMADQRFANEFIRISEYTVKVIV